MILLFNNTPGFGSQDSIKTGIDRIVAAVEKSQTLKQIKTNNINDDGIKIKQQFPVWMQQLYEENPNNVPVIDFFIYYYKWFFDLNGYGLGFYLEDLRDPFYVPDIFYQAYADLIFYNQLNFTEYPELLVNFKTFFIHYYDQYVPIRGEPDALIYILKSLFGATTATATTVNSGTILVVSNLDPKYYNLFKRLACPFSFDVIFKSI